MMNFSKVIDLASDDPHRTGRFEPVEPFEAWQEMMQAIDKRVQRRAEIRLLLAYCLHRSGKYATLPVKKAIWRRLRKRIRAMAREYGYEEASNAVNQAMWHTDQEWLRVRQFALPHARHETKKKENEMEPEVFVDNAAAKAGIRPNHHRVQRRDPLENWDERIRELLMDYVKNPSGFAKAELLEFLCTCISAKGREAALGALDEGVNRTVCYTQEIAESVKSALPSGHRENFRALAREAATSLRNLAEQLEIAGEARDD